MNIPKEVTEKVKKYECHTELARSIFKDIEKWIVEHINPDIKVIDVFITQKPEGRCVAEGEFVDDEEVTPGTYHGTYYYKIADRQDFVGCLFILQKYKENK